MTKTKWALLAIKSTFVTVIVCAILATVYAVGPSVETKWFPVVGKLQILSKVENSEGQTVVYAAFRKMRDCEYIGIQWFVGNNEEFQRVPIELLREEGDTSSPNRPVGFQKAGPWIVHASLSDFEQNSFATLTHRCNPFWMTTTNFYP